MYKTQTIRSRTVIPYAVTSPDKRKRSNVLYGEITLLELWEPTDDGDDYEEKDEDKDNDGDVKRITGLTHSKI